MTSDAECVYEIAVVKSLKSGTVDEKISAHINSCFSCRNTAKVVGFFQINLENDLKTVRLPAAGLIWWKSRLREKQRADKQISKPIFIVQTIAAAIFAGVLIWLYSSGALQFTPFESAVGRVISSFEQIIFSIIVGIFSFTAISLTLIFALRHFMTEK